MSLTRKLEKAKAGGGASSSAVGELSASTTVAAAAAIEDREHGDWLLSIMAGGVLHAYARDHWLPKSGWRVPDGREPEPAPRGNERVILMSYLDQGLGLPIRPFLREVLDFFHVQLHHLPPNTITHLSYFVTLREAFLGIPPTGPCSSTFSTSSRRRCRRTSTRCAGHSAYRRSVHRATSR